MWKKVIQWFIDQELIWKTLIKWLIFNVIFALIPLLAIYLFQKIIKAPIKFEVLVSHGELLLISSAMAAVALGEILTSDKKRGILMVCSSGGCFLIVIFASMLFSFVVRANFLNIIDISYVSMVSIFVYSFAFLTSGSGIILSEA